MQSGSGGKIVIPKRRHLPLAWSSSEPDGMCRVPLATSAIHSVPNAEAFMEVMPLQTFNQKSGLGNFDHQFANVYAFEQAVERFRSVLQAIDNGFTALQFALADPLNELAAALLPSRHKV